MEGTFLSDLVLLSQYLLLKSKLTDVPNNRKNQSVIYMLVAMLDKPHTYQDKSISQDVGVVISNILISNF